MIVILFIGETLFFRYFLFFSLIILHDFVSDLKPENLLMNSESNDADVKLVDFGFASPVDGFNLNRYCGTLGYMAPEIMKGQMYGKPVDMWAFGVILYILIGGCK